MLEKIILAMTMFSALALGLFIFLRPLQVFAIQKRFYELINWRIEPISMEKEIRNTRLMGLFLIIFVIAAGVYVCLR